MECLIHAIENIDDGEPSVLVFGSELELLAVVPGIGGRSKFFDSFNGNYMYVSPEKRRNDVIYILIRRCLDSQLICPSSGSSLNTSFFLLLFETFVMGVPCCNSNGTVMSAKVGAGAAAWTSGTLLRPSMETRAGALVV